MKRDSACFFWVGTLFGVEEGENSPRFLPPRESDEVSPQPQPPIPLWLVAL